MPSSYSEDFESYSANQDPTGWTDTDESSSLVVDDSLFKTYDVSGNTVFGTTSTLANIHSHYTGGGAETSDYRYSGRMYITAAGGGIGLTFFSDYPNSDTYYRLRRFGTTGSATFRLNSHGTSMTGGTTDSGVDPVANTWYQFKIEVEDTGTQTEIRAKIWEDGATEPTAWQIDAVDNSGTRITTGTFGLWAFNGGSKYWDDLTVESLSATQPTPTPTVEASATPTNTPVPPTATTYTTEQRMTLSLAGQRIAVREIGYDETGTANSWTIHYFLTDHLGSSSQMLHHSNNDLVANSLARHTPFGDYRTTPSADNTDLGFTGHRENRDIGLTYMNARFYVSGIGRFASADSIVPDPINPQSFNRFTYVENNPINFIDPTGHCAGDPNASDPSEVDGQLNIDCWNLAYSIAEEYGLSINYLGLLSMDQLQQTDFARVFAYAMEQLSLVNQGDISDVSALMNIISYAIEDVAGGDRDLGFVYVASVFYRDEYSRQTLNPRFSNTVNSSFKYNRPLFQERTGLEDFGVSGFDERFIDFDENQVEHFIGIAALNYWLGGNDTIGNIASSYQDPVSSADDLQHIRDRTLSLVAVDFTVALSNAESAIARRNVYSTFQNRLSTRRFSGGGDNQKPLTE